jgi:Domain of unknown function (DUF4224)
MTAIFEMLINNETLTSEELVAITGSSLKSHQIEWLNKNGWVFFKNRGGEPIVGTFYARLKLSGINPKSFASSDSWNPDFTGVH